MESHEFALLFKEQHDNTSHKSQKVAYGPHEILIAFLCHFVSPPFYYHHIMVIFPPSIKKVVLSRPLLSHPSPRPKFLPPQIPHHTPDRSGACPFLHDPLLPLRARRQLWRFDQVQRSKESQIRSPPRRLIGNRVSALSDSRPANRLLQL